MTNDELLKHINEIADKLIDHADSLIILVSVDDGDTTSLIHARRGNWHAILGLMEDYKRKTLANSVSEFVKEDQQEL